MERSSRSTPTGPGSRGGRWGHDRPPEYWRLWRAAHPEYRERERRRALLRHAEDRLANVVRFGRVTHHRLPATTCAPAPAAGRPLGNPGDRDVTGGRA